MSAPRPRPDAWARTCRNPEHGRKMVVCGVEDDISDRHDFCPICNCSGWLDEGPFMALWGERWAAAVWMAAAVEAGGGYLAIAGGDSPRSPNTGRVRVTDKAIFFDHVRGRLR